MLDVSRLREGTVHVDVSAIFCAQYVVHKFSLDTIPNLNV